MANIVLIEPNYQNKYAPLGLMKIAFYHKEMRGDLVWFSKGELPERIDDNVRRKVKADKYYVDRYGDALKIHLDEVDVVIKNKSWDRVYITTLFTFEYDAVIETVNYAKTLVGDNSKIYVGGILATLMPEKLKEDTGVNVLVGQLTDTSVIGYGDNINVDLLTPDYSMLSNTNYKYANSNAYYSYTTRGCGMNCGFCAVKTLEPEFVPYISIKEQIRTIDRLYGPKKDLLLMDNNILKSKYLERIVEDLIELGFYKDAYYMNPTTGKANKRYVDFNQGLDAKLMTPKKASLLGKLALKPGRVAFDHIEDADIYVNAMKLLIENGTTYLSNYLLYNSDSFHGKGTLYNADKPDDLYNRLKINIELQVEENMKYGENKVQIYSFPMKYIPLDDKKRGYIGPYWNKKLLRAIQVMLIPTQGKGVSNPDYFYNIFGNTAEEFLEIIRMPEVYLSYRGVPQKSRVGGENLYDERMRIYNHYLERIAEWKKLYNSFNDDEKNNFEEVIGNNKFDYEDYKRIKYSSVKKIYMHYVTPSKLMKILEELYISNNHYEIILLKNYLENEASYIYEEFIEFVSMSTLNRKSFNILNDVFEAYNVIDMLDTFESYDFNNDTFYKIISNISVKTLYTCIHTWIRNRRLNGLMKFSNDVAKILANVDNMKLKNRDIYIKESIIKLFKDFLRYNYPYKYKLSDKYDLYKYDLMIVSVEYDPFKICDEMINYQLLYLDAKDVSEDIYCDNLYYDDYECMMDLYNEVHQKY